MLYEIANHTRAFLKNASNTQWLCFTVNGITHLFYED
jgi:hypothetical protein